jgi:hypothetical protein
MKKSRLPRSSSARAASMNATLDTADASGDLRQEGDQSGLFSAVRQEVARRWFARFDPERLGASLLLMRGPFYRAILCLCGTRNLLQNNNFVTSLTTS